MSTVLALQQIGSMTICTGFLLALIVLAGCASPNVYKGLVLGTCGDSGSAAEFGSGACRSGAEYDTARKKVRNSTVSTAAEEDRELEEIVPLDPRYKAEAP
jgi:hypothetical protein